MKKTLIPIRLTIKTDSYISEAEKVLATQVLGGTLVLDEPGLKVFQLKDGTVIEYFSPGSFPPEHIFDYGNVVPGFAVNDLKLTVDTLTSAGATMLNDVVSLPAHSYCYLKMSSGTVVGLYQSNSFVPDKSCPN